MVPALNTRGPQEDDLLGGEWPERKVGRYILVGVIAIGAVLALGALVSARFEVGPRLPAVAYLLLATSATMLLGNFMITLIRDEMRAGSYLIGFWALILIVLLAIFAMVG